MELHTAQQQLQSPSPSPVVLPAAEINYPSTAAAATPSSASLMAPPRVAVSAPQSNPPGGGGTVSLPHPPQQQRPATAPATHSAAFSPLNGANLQLHASLMGFPRQQPQQQSTPLPAPAGRIGASYRTGSTNPASPISVAARHPPPYPAQFQHPLGFPAVRAPSPMAGTFSPSGAVGGGEPPSPPPPSLPPSDLQPYCSSSASFPLHPSPTAYPYGSSTAMRNYIAAAVAASNSAAFPYRLPVPHTPGYGLPLTPTSSPPPPSPPSTSAPGFAPSSTPALYKHACLSAPVWPACAAGASPHASHPPMPQWRPTIPTAETVSASGSGELANANTLLHQSSSSSQLSASLQHRIMKTKLCVHHLHGRCARGPNCTFAHCASELRKPPNLYKTRLCINFTNTGSCPKGYQCRFAHGHSELRQGDIDEGSDSRLPSSAGSTASRSASLHGSTEPLSRRSTFAGESYLSSSGGSRGSVESPSLMASLRSPATPFLPKMTDASLSSQMAPSSFFSPANAVARRTDNQLECDAIEALLKLPEGSRHQLLGLVMRTVTTNSMTTGELPPNAALAGTALTGTTSLLSPSSSHDSDFSCMSGVGVGGISGAGTFCTPCVSPKNQSPIVNGAETGGDIMQSAESKSVESKSVDLESHMDLETTKVPDITSSGKGQGNSDTEPLIDFSLLSSVAAAAVAAAGGVSKVADGAIPLAENGADGVGELDTYAAALLLCSGLGGLPSLPPSATQTSPSNFDASRIWMSAHQADDCRYDTTEPSSDMTGTAMSVADLMLQLPAAAAMTPLSGGDNVDHLYSNINHSEATEPLGVLGAALAMLEATAEGSSAEALSPAPTMAYADVSVPSTSLLGPLTAYGVQTSAPVSIPTTPIERNAKCDFRKYGGGVAGVAGCQEAAGITPDRYQSLYHALEKYVR